MRYAVLIIAAVSSISLSCATTKPCPPAPTPQVIEVKVPVVQAWPAPVEVVGPSLQLPTLSSAGAPVDVLLLAMLHDADEWARYAHELEIALQPYRLPPK